MKNHYLDRGTGLRQQSFTEFERQVRIALIDLGYANMSDPNITSKDLERAVLEVMTEYLRLLEHGFI